MPFMRDIAAEARWLSANNTESQVPAEKISSNFCAKPLFVTSFYLVPGEDTHRAHVGKPLLVGCWNSVMSDR